MSIYTPEEAANIGVAENLEQAFVKGTVNTICRGAPYLAGYGFLTGNLPAIAFGISGSIVCGLPLLPAPPPPPPIFTPVTGGQCQGVNYRVVVQGRWTRSDGVSQVQTSPEQVLGGSIGALELVVIDISPGQSELQVRGKYNDGRNSITYFSIGSNSGNPVKWDWYNYVLLQRTDGLADNCGDAPPQNIVLPPGVEQPPGWPDEPFLPGTTQQIPYLPPNYTDGRQPWNVPIIFPPILLPVILSPTADIRVPISAPINIKGELNLFPDAQISGEFNLQLDKDGNIRTEPDLLPEEKEKPKPCPPVPVLTQFVVPYVECGDEPSFRTGVVSAVADSVPSGLSDKLLASADLAAIGCRSLHPSQASPSMLASGSVGGVIGRLVMSDELDPLVVSVVVKIFPQRPDDFRETKLFQGTGQRLFGIVSWCTAGSVGGTEQVELWDMLTEVRLERSPSPRVLKMLFKPGLRWELWDTGERVWIS